MREETRRRLSGALPVVSQSSSAATPSPLHPPPQQFGDASPHAPSLRDYVLRLWATRRPLDGTNDVHTPGREWCFKTSRVDGSRSVAGRASRWTDGWLCVARIFTRRGGTCDWSGYARQRFNMSMKVSARREAPRFGCTLPPPPAGGNPFHLDAVLCSSAMRNSLGRIRSRSHRWTVSRLDVR